MSDDAQLTRLAQFQAKKRRDDRGRFLPACPDATHLHDRRPCPVCTEEPAMPRKPRLKGRRTYLAIAGAVVAGIARPTLRALLPTEAAGLVEAVLTEEVAAALVVGFGGLAATFRRVAVTDSQAVPSGRPSL